MKRHYQIFADKKGIELGFNSVSSLYAYLGNKSSNPLSTSILIPKYLYTRNLGIFLLPQRAKQGQIPFYYFPFLFIKIFLRCIHMLFIHVNIYCKALFISSL